MPVFGHLFVCGVPFPTTLSSVCSIGIILNMLEGPIKLQDVAYLEKVQNTTLDEDPPPGPSRLRSLQAIGSGQAHASGSIITPADCPRNYRVRKRNAAAVTPATPRHRGLPCRT
jgi:hypothetical protein